MEGRFNTTKNIVNVNFSYFMSENFKYHNYKQLNISFVVIKIKDKRHYELNFFTIVNIFNELALPYLAELAGYISVRLNLILQHH
jgi:hypothetical protein